MKRPLTKQISSMKRVVCPGVQSPPTPSFPYEKILYAVADESTWKAFPHPSIVGIFLMNVGSSSNSMYLTRGSGSRGDVPHDPLVRRNRFE